MGPPGTKKVVHDSGWMQFHIFTEWFQHFIDIVKPTKDDPVLLILDGHKTHTLNLPVIDLARDNGVVILCLPPHTTHRLQPLDVTYMLPLSTYYSQEVAVYLRKNPGRVVTIYQIAELFGKAYLKASTPLNAVNGWSQAGLHPINRFIFSDNDFAPSLPTDMEEPVEGAPAQQQQPLIENLADPQAGIIQRPAPSQENQPTPEELPDIQSHQTTSSNQIPAPSTSGYVSPEHIMPYPKANSAVTKRRKSTNRGKAAVISGSPYKNDLLQKKLEKEEKQRKKEERKAKRLEEKAKKAEAAKTEAQQKVKKVSKPRIKKPTKKQLNVTTIRLTPPEPQTPLKAVEETVTLTPPEAQTSPKAVEETSVSRVRRQVPLHMETFKDYFSDDSSEVVETDRPGFIRDFAEDSDEWMPSD